ncbi:Nucleotidylyl transferase [Heliocybe sulcata]|uniref:ethanolamine-phosphate cytidylyltransferase n=1 Tax=Heliocybe sulcata TaxID=5364 RepID=A0A5C3NIL6_9AGAM|nr:Nucleotidylyl transferase [Heliocybe sulcata]
MAEVLKPTVLWLDGCFDGFHYAHANAIRQARKLFVGPVRMLACVHSDEEILKNKGPSLFDEQERYAVVASCRWVDEVVEGAPYITDLDTLDKYNVDFLVHGDDAVVDAMGRDIYAPLKAQGRYREFRRTEGVSTTSLVQRVLEYPRLRQECGYLDRLLEEFVESIPGPFPVVDFGSLSGAMASPFCSLVGAKVYVPGSWDCFSAGHVEFLRRVKEAVTSDSKVVVGVWSDEEMTGGPPLLTVVERALAVVQCKYTDAVLWNVPKCTPASRLGFEMVVNRDAYQHEPDSAQVIEVLMPPLQTLSKLQDRVHGRIDAFKERQRPSHIDQENVTT